MRPMPKNGGNCLDETLAEFDILEAWMRNEDIHRLHICDFDRCEWSGREGDLTCFLGDAPEVIQKVDIISHRSFKFDSLSILKQHYPRYDYWYFVVLERLEIHVDNNSWIGHADVWFNNEKRYIIDSDSCNIITTEGYVRWTRSGKSWLAKVEAATRVERGILDYDLGDRGFY